LNMLPLDFLPGSALLKWHKGVWAFISALSLFLLVQVMLLPAASGARHGESPVVTTLVLFLVFGIGSVAFDRYFSRRRRREEEEGSSSGSDATDTRSDTAAAAGTATASRA